MLATTQVAAGNLSIAWTPVTGATGYRIYYGTGPGEYVRSHDAGPATQATLTGLTNCTSYYLAVKAYNWAGESEEFSNEITGWSRPEFTRSFAVKQGTETTFEIEGSNFRSGSVVQIEHPDVHLLRTTLLDCGRIEVAVAVDPPGPGLRAARTGRFPLSVTHPDGAHGSAAQGFEVLVEPSRFDVNRSQDATLDRLDGADTVWLARLFGSREGRDALYDPDFDLDGDGWVDGGDLAFVASHLGRCWTGSSWAADACAR
jgi:hypothetical protein